MTFDFETSLIDFNNRNDHAMQIVMVAWKMSDSDRVKDCYGNLLECGEFWADLERADVLVAQNAKFDASRLLQQLGYDPTGKLWYCTKIGEKVRYANQRISLSLGDMAPRYGFAEGKETYVDTAMKAGVEPADIDERYLRARCRRDVRQTEGVARAQMEHLHRTGKLHLALTRCLLLPILADIEAQGMCLDKERVYEEYDEATKELARCKAELEKLIGNVNLNSPDQKAVLLYQTLGFKELKNGKGKPRRNKPSKQFPDGRPKTDSDTMSQLATQAKTIKQRLFFDLQKKYSKQHAALTKNLEFFKGVVDEREDGIFYAEFNQCNTATDRLSSSGMTQTFSQFSKPKSVQFQNMPRVFKRLFKAREAGGDYVMTETDGSQLEFRVAAFVGQDAQAMADISDPDFDAHCTSAAEMVQADYEEFLQEYRAGDKTRKAQRTAAKAHTFKPLFGGTKGTEEEERWYMAFQQRYEGLYTEQCHWVDKVTANDGTLLTPWGKDFVFQFRLNQWNGEPMWGGKSIRPSVFNYPIQSLATAEIIPIALIYLFHRVRKEGLRVRFVNTVHDSVIAEVHKDDIEQYKQLAFRAFTTDVYEYLYKRYGIKFNVPLGAEVCAGTHWSEGEEEAVDVQPPTFGDG